MSPIFILSVTSLLPCLNVIVAHTRILLILKYRCKYMKELVRLHNTMV